MLSLPTDDGIHVCCFHPAPPRNATLPLAELPTRTDSLHSLFAARCLVRHVCHRQTHTRTRNAGMATWSCEATCKRCVCLTATTALTYSHRPCQSGGVTRDTGGVHHTMALAEQACAPSSLTQTQTHPRSRLHEATGRHAPIVASRLSRCWQQGVRCEVQREGHITRQKMHDMKHKISEIRRRGTM